ncbi:MAG TPA: tetratricopeptide repeat protein [Steroidobacteraceae bacterium]|nr:tetratricopeptide repeat protein [Steroidobacteraceae bacterium]
MRKPGADTSVIFVHGILSSGETAWLNGTTGSSWPRLLVDDTAGDGYGVYVFTYQTDVFSGSYSLGDVVDALKEHLRLDRALDARRLIFVCHSMGGLAVRKYLVDRSSDLSEKGIAVGLYLVASPSLGSRYADWLSPLARLMGHAQAEALRFVSNNLWLADLDKNFKNLRDSGRLQIVGKELVEDKFVVVRRFLRTQVVAPFSGAVYFGEQFKVARSDHSSIAKPKDNGEIQHRLLLQFITDMIGKTPSAARSPPQPLTPTMTSGASATMPSAMPNVSGPAIPSQQASLVQTPMGLQLLVPLAGGSPVQIVQSARPRPSFDELFEVLPGGDEIPRALFGIGSRKTAALSPQDAEYVKDREGVPDVKESLQSALNSAGGRLLVLGRGGIGKTREVAELSRALASKHWKVCLAKAGHHTRIGPLAELPIALVDSRFLFVFDNVHASMLVPAEDPTPYVARLEAFLDDIERLAPGDVSAIAIARDEPRFMQQLGLRPGDARWGTFGNYRLPEFTLEGLQRILVSLSQHAGVEVAADDVPKLVENSDRKPETLFINVDVAAAARTALTSSNWLPTEGDSWRQKSLAANARFPLARHVVEALRMVTLAGIAPRVEYVQSISRALSGEDGTRAIDGLVDEGLLRLRQNMLTAFSTEQLEEEGAEPRPLAATLELIAPVVIDEASKRREWLDDLGYLAGAFGRATNSKEAERIASLAIDKGLDTSRVYQLRGAARFLMGQLPSAVSDLSTAIARDERDAQSYVLRGNVRNLLGEFDGVIEDMKKALELGRDEAAIHATLGYAHARLQQWEPALAGLTLAVQKDANAPLGLFVGAIRQQTGDYAGAEADFTSVLERGLTLDPALDVLTGIGSGNASQAFEEYEKKMSASSHSDDSLVYGMRGIVRVMLGKFAAADPDLTTAIEGGFGAKFVGMFTALEQTKLPGLQQPAKDLRGVVDIFSRDAAIFQVRAAARLELGRHEEALQDAEEALARGFTPQLAHWLSAQIYNRMGRFAEAEAAATRAIDLGQVEAEIYTLRGFARLNTNDTPGAAADLDRAIELGRQDGWVFYWRALARQRQNNLKDAEADLGEAIERDGALAPAWFLRAGLRIDTGNPTGAEADADAGLGASPEDPTGFTVRGGARINLNKFAEGEADVSRAIELGRNDFIVYRWRALARMNLGRLADSDADFSESLHRGDPDPQTSFMRAAVRLELERYEEAEQDLDAALAGGMTSAWVYRHRGHARLSLGKLEAAEQDLSAAIDGGVDDVNVYVDRADCLRQQSRFDAAVADYTAAISKGRDDARVHFLRALCYRELGSYCEAERDLDAAIARDPAEIVGLAQRSFVRLQRGRFTAAESDAHAALERTTAEQGELRGLLFTVRGHSRYGQGDFTTALADFDAVLAASPDDSGIRVVRIASLLALRRTAEAEAELPKVESNPVSGSADAAAGLLALMREDFADALARFEQARQATDGDEWHSWNGLANLLLGHETDAYTDYRRCRESSPPGDCAIAVVELDLWTSRFGERLQSRTIQTAIANIRGQLVKLVADENAGEEG